VEQATLQTVGLAHGTTAGNKVLLWLPSVQLINPTSRTSAASGCSASSERRAHRRQRRSAPGAVLTGAVPQVKTNRSFLMARKLAISNTVQPSVTVVTAGSDGRNATFKFSLTCDRIDGDSLRKALASESLSVATFLNDITKGWDGQRLVLEEDGSPSAFSPEAFADLLSIAGVPALCLAAYLKEVTAKEKN
jgi:hypothetical protein